MKKIVGILLAGAMAFSAFAADVNAKVQLEGELLNFCDGNISAFSINKPAAQHWNPLFNVAVNGDRAGAEFAVFTGNIEDVSWNKGFQVAVNRFKLWMSPIDGLKLNFGLIGTGLNQESILYSKSESNPEGYGYGVSYAANGFGIDLAFLPGWGTAWFTKVDDSVVNETVLKVEYAADFGKINALLDAKETFKDLKFGVGYSNTFGGINMFANVLGYYKDDFNKLRVELFAKGNASGFGWAVFLAPNINLGDVTTIDLQMIAKADYSFNGLNAYVLVGGDGLNGRQGVKIGLVKDKSLTFTVKPGISGNIGGASWDVGVQFDYVKKSPILITVPIALSMGW